VKSTFLLLVLIIGVVGLWLIFRNRATQLPPPNQPALKHARPNVYRDMRDAALHGSRTAFGLSAPAASNQPWGVLMEIGFPEGAATVIALSDGSASIYFSSGGGSIGGIGHESIRKAAQAMVNLVAKFQPQMTTAKEVPLPKNGETIFYALTDGGVFTANAAENDLGEQRHSLSPLFFAGQEVITQYRLVEGRK
jgi:hypothetical protein